MFLKRVSELISILLNVFPAHFFKLEYSEFKSRIQNHVVHTFSQLPASALLGQFVKHFQF